MQVGHRGAAPHPVPLGELVVADPVLLRPVEVIVGLMPGLLRRLEEGVHQGMPGPAVADGQRAAGTVQVARAALVVLGAQEVGQHVRPAPSGRAVGGPLVVVCRISADVDHRVHRRRAAQHLAAGQVPAPEVQPGLGIGQVVPVPLGLEQLPESRRNVDLQRGIGRTGLDQGHPHVGIFTQPGREHASGRAGPDDDVVSHGSLQMSTCHGSRRDDHRLLRRLGRLST